jgi:hypothetical protein
MLPLVSIFTMKASGHGSWLACISPETQMPFVLRAGWTTPEGQTIRGSGSGEKDLAQHRGGHRRPIHD